MSTQRISSGVVHTVPADVRALLGAKCKVHEVWEDITPLARNEWLCWITSAKKTETRERRICIMKEKLGRGERRPCCFAGCPHR